MSGVPRGVNRQLWVEALELADGDPARIEVRSTTSLVVHNTAAWEPRSDAAAGPTPARERSGAPATRAGRRAKGRSQPAAAPLAPPLPLPEWRSAAPTRKLQATPVKPKSEVPAFLAPVQPASSG